MTTRTHYAKVRLDESTTALPWLWDCADCTAGEYDVPLADAQAAVAQHRMIPVVPSPRNGSNAAVEAHYRGRGDR